MEEVRRTYENQNQHQTISQQDRFSITEAKALFDNLDKGIYEDALKYLTGPGEDQRGLSLETLKKYKVGLGSEKFTDQDGVYQSYDSVFFPLYAPKKDSSSLLDGVKSIKSAKKLEWLAELEQVIDTDMAQFVKMKVRAAYKQHKSKQRVKPSCSKVR